MSSGLIRFFVSSEGRWRVSSEFLKRERVDGHEKFWGWPKCSLSFFHTTLQKNLSELFSRPSASRWCHFV